MRRRRRLLPVVLLGHYVLVRAETSEPNTGDLPQAFLFGYSTGPLTLPLLPSCPGSITIPGISSLTTSDTSDPIAPYTLTMLVHEQLMDGAGVRYERMYARSQSVGDMSRPWSARVPWMNGTQMVGCMWAANGVSGGCQDLMTVAATSETTNAYANATSECRVPSIEGSWVTPPSQTLDVLVEHPAGELASNGWPAACSDLRVTPRNGTAPFTLLIAPAFHPPVNITSSGGSMNYTVRLTHGQAFMLGVFDSAGNSFAFGPLHAGRSANIGCLAVATGQKMPVLSGGVAVGALAGGIVGAFLLGAVGAVLLLWGCCIRRKGRTSQRGSHQLLPSPTQRPVSLHDAHVHDSYLNPKPFDPYADVDSPNPNSSASPPHLSYGSRETRHTNGNPVYPGDADLYDPHISPLPRPGGGGVAHGTWHGPGPLPLEAGEFGTVRGMTTSTSLPPGGPGFREHRASVDATGAGAPQRYSDPSRLRLVGTPTSEAFDSTSTRHTQQPYRHSATHEKHSSHPLQSPRTHAHASDAHRSPRQAPSDGSHHSRHLEHEHEHDRDHQPDRHREHSTSPHRRPRNVYVVHSDAGPGGDVHIRLPPMERDARVIEMPPDYRHEVRSSASASAGGEVGFVASRDRDRPTSAHSGLSSGADAAAPGPVPVVAQRARRRSEVERVEAGYLGLEVNDLGAGKSPVPSPGSVEVGGVPDGPGEMRVGIGGNGDRNPWLNEQRTGSGVENGGGMTPELRARAEAAMAEKSR